MKFTAVQIEQYTKIRGDLNEKKERNPNSKLVLLAHQ
jgi:hypothetical protein